MTQKQLANLRQQIHQTYWDMGADEFAQRIGYNITERGFDAYFDEKWEAFKRLSTSIRTLGPLFEQIYEREEEDAE